MCDNICVHNIKNDMMLLWKEIFGDNDTYIKLLFDTYFNIDNVDYIYVGSRLASSLFSVRYNLIPDKLNYDNNDRCNADEEKDMFRLSSMYLCGLATSPDYRNRGFISSLINRYNLKLFNDNISISFLIPVDYHMSMFYNKFGYVNISYSTHDKYTSAHVFSDNKFIINDKEKYVTDVHDNDKIVYRVFDIGDYLSVVCNCKYKLTDVEYLVDCNCKLLYDAYCCLCNSLIGDSGLRIHYSYKDFITIVLENIISKGKILFLIDDKNKPSGLLFCSNIVEGLANVQLLVSNSEEKENILLQSLKNLFGGDISVTVNSYALRDKVYSPFSVDALSPGVHVLEHIAVADAYKRRKPFAMAKILNVAEVLKFVAVSYPCSEFSILIKQDEYPKNRGFYSVSHGLLGFTPLGSLSDDELRQIELRCHNDLNCFSLTVPELAAFLWRNTDPAGVEDRAIAIPRFPVNVALLLE